MSSSSTLRSYSSIINQSPLPISLNRSFSSTLSFPRLSHPVFTRLVSQCPASRLLTIRCRSAESDSEPFEGCDYKHWLVVLNNEEPFGNKEQMIDFYVQMLAKMVGSDEEAKRRMYSVFFESFFGFGCEIDLETAHKMEDIPNVKYALPDSYVDPQIPDYGGELFVNGQITQRDPEIEERVGPASASLTIIARDDPFAER